MVATGGGGTDTGGVGGCAGIASCVAAITDWVGLVGGGATGSGVGGGCTGIVCCVAMGAGSTTAGGGGGGWAGRVCCVAMGAGSTAAGGAGGGSGVGGAGGLGWPAGSHPDGSTGFASNAELGAGGAGGGGWTKSSNGDAAGCSGFSAGNVRSVFASDGGGESWSGGTTAKKSRTVLSGRWPGQAKTCLRASSATGSGCCSAQSAASDASLSHSACTRAASSGVSQTCSRSQAS